MELFKNRKIAFGTMHKKDELLREIIEKELGLFVVNPKINTDKFGTFTNEIKRKNDQIKTAKIKAEKAISETGLDIAIANEGSFGPHPKIPFIPGNLEYFYLVDKKHNLEFEGYSFTHKTNYNESYVSSAKEAKELAFKWGFPEHGIIVKRKRNSKFFVYKNIENEKDLEKYVNKILSLPFHRKAFIETDMRAHKNPTRQENIKLAFSNLVENIKNTKKTN